MREIIFRGKDAKGKWVFGDLLTNCQFSDKSKGCAIKDTTNHINSGFFDLMPTRIDPKTVGQYTGLEDKNGKKIFEGDIVDCGGFFDIATMKMFPLYWLEKEEFGWEGELLVEASDCEIAGNVFDNPELLEVSK